MKKKLLIVALLLFVKGFGQNITVSPNAYTPSQLVSEILVKNSCLAQVTNITKNTGTDYGYTQGNGIAYFQNTNPNFPITSGVLLSTGNAAAAQGPNTTISSFTAPAWAGDADLNAALLAQGITITSRNATVLEFDFTAVTSTFSVDFLFASEEYGTYQCTSKDAFAFLLTNLNTNVTTNVAVVPSTNQPISVATISNTLYNSACGVNPQYFGLFNGGSNAAASATNFEGQTVLLNASHTLVPGNQYHIKLVIADDAGVNGTDGDYDSAVFFPEGSFNLGHEVVGEDLTAENGTGLCNDEVHVINTGLSETTYDLSWTKDGAPVAGGSSISISETGTYVLTIFNPATNCTATQTLIAEAAAPILANEPEDLLACGNASGSYVYDLSLNTPVIKEGLNPGTVVTYHTTEAAANANTGALPALYTSPGNQTIWARVKSYNSDCYVLVSFQLLIVEPPIANQPQNLTQCSINGGGTTAIFNLTTQNAAILGAQSAADNTITYYTTMANAVNNTNAITSPGNYTSANQTIYARIQRNFSVSCYAITNFTITVAPKPVIPDPADVFTCNNYVLPVLANGAQYYTAPGGTGTMLLAGTTLTISQTLYVYKQADTPPFCANENSFSINISSTPIVTPGNAYACQSYTMPVPPAGSFYYTGPGGTGTQITAGTVITSTQIVYFYVPAAPYCTQNDHFTVLITAIPVVPNPGNMNLCQPYTLPALTVGNYYTGPAGTGTIIPAGTVISQTQTIYIYAAVPGGQNTTCTSQSVFTVNISNVTLSPFANITNCGPYQLPELTLGAYFTGPNGTGTPLTAGSLISTSQTVYVYEASPANPACANQQSFTVTINPLPTLAPFIDVEACGSYTLPALPAGASYYAQSGAIGPIAAGTVITESQAVFVQSAPNQFGCVRERDFQVIVIGDEADNPGDQSVCDSYALPALLIGDYYTGPGATGDLLQPGTVLSQSQTVYVYVVSQTTPVCIAESNFIVTITPQPVVPQIANVVACTSYTLPTLPAGVVYRTGPGGTGTVLPAGLAITSTQTIYAFKQSGGTPNCTAETEFTVTIITGSLAPASVTVCSSGYTLPELPMGNYYNQPNGAGPVVLAGTLVTTTKTLYVYMPTTTGTNCTANNSFTITVLPPVLADNPPDVTACGSYTVPQAVNGNYYSFSNGNFTLVPAGTVITASTSLYVINTNPTHPECRVQHGVHIIITGPTVQDVPDQTVCEGYVLPVISSGTYYTQSGGTGQVLLPGTNITTTQTIYIYAQTGTTLVCSDEESFTVTILPSAPIAPSAVVAACGNYVLPALTVGNYYTGTNGTGTLLTAGQSITATQNVYIYAPAGGQFNCSAQSTLQIIINPQAPPNVSACDSYVLPALTFGNYFTGPAGTGTPKFAGNVITTTQNMYVYVATGTTPNCTDNNFFNIAINQTPVLPAIETPIVRCDAYELPALSVGNYYTGPGGTGSLLSTGSFITSSQTVYVYAQTGTAPNCTAEASIDITIHVTPIADARSAVEICDSYTLTPLVTGNYFALPGGPNAPGQTAYSAGDVITQSMEMYIYAVSATSAACFSENSFTITIQSIDADNPGPHEDCDSYTLPALNQGDYYTLSGGPDVAGQVLMHAGDVITQSVTLYIYAELGGRLNCNDEHALPITIYQTPVVDDTQTDLSTCFTYTLPPLTVGNYFTATNGGGTPLAVGSQITQSQDIYIYAATGSLTKICSDEHMYHVTVNSIEVPEIADFYACQIFTLEPLAVGNYFTQPGGQGTLLTAGTAITESQTIYIYGETNTVPNCTDESDFVITIVQPPLPTTPDALSTCALDLSGHGVFNLTPAMQQALNGQPNVAVSIYETLADATFGTNAITNSTAYTNIFAFNQTLHIRLESTLAPGCITLVTLQLIANPKPIATEPSAPYQLCDN
ncbi:choice-of-anchor L domain-containing protein, partial [Flavobacterium subsaxonicum]